MKLFSPDRWLDIRGMLITISGVPGSGKTTVAQLLAARLGLPHVYAGDLYRQEAQAARADAGAFNELCERDHSIDRQLDAEMAARARAGRRRARRAPGRVSGGRERARRAEGLARRQRRGARPPRGAARGRRLARGAGGEPRPPRLGREALQGDLRLRPRRHRRLRRRPGDRRPHARGAGRATLAARGAARRFNGGSRA